MHNRVQSFPVELHDIYEDARASMRTPRRRGWPKVWGLTTVAALLGAGLGWYLAIDRAVVPTALEASTTVGAKAGASVAEVGNSVEAAAGTSASGVTTIETAAAWLRHDRLEAAPTRPLDANAWPITLHRAGDGQFYADLSIGDHIINCRIDPDLALSTLRLSDLPGGATLGSGHWEATDVALEHLRLPMIRFMVSDDPAAETVIGGDLLARFFTIEERIDRLRLAPRAS